MIIVFSNQKGGVGKTTGSVNVAYGLSQLGKKVLLIDLDPQGNTSIIYHSTYKLPPEEQIERSKTELTVKELFLNKHQSIRETIYPAFLEGKEIDNLEIIPSNIHLAAAAEQITARPHREKLLENHLKKIKSHYDYIIIDTPPNLGILTVNAVYSAELIIIPSKYSIYSLEAIAGLFNTISEIKETENYRYRILRNEFDQRNRQSNAFVNKQLEPYVENLFKTVIRRNESINQAPMVKEPIFTFDPDSNGAQDYRSLSEEIVNG